MGAVRAHHAQARSLGPLALGLAWSVRRVSRVSPWSSELQQNQI